MTIMVQFKFTLTKGRTLAIILAAISIMIIDSTIVKYFGFRELTTPIYVGIFITFATLFVGIVVILLRFMKSKDTDSQLERGISGKGSYLIASLSQYSLILILVTIIQPIIILKSYNILSLLAAVYISHFSALFFLISLTLALVDWIRTRKSKILTFYAISFGLMALTVITSLIYASNVLVYQVSNVKPSSIHNSLLNLPRSELAIYFGPTLDIISLVSFVSIWIASAILLNTYSRRIGKIRYWTIISIPLIYFLFPFETYFLNIFSQLIASFPVEYGILNVLVFSATKQVGALFFSLAYFAAATLVAKYEMHRYLLITAIGMAILYGSIEIETLLYATYPPFDLVTISFMPIGSYLVFKGITLSAKFLARDKELRAAFYDTAMSQLSLLRTIGVTQMEKEMIKSYKSIEKRTKLDLKDTRFEKDNVREILHDVVDDLDKDNVREILHDVLNELYVKSRPKSKI